MINTKYATHLREPFFEIAKNIIKRESTVLDIGAGNGSFANYCERNDFYLLDGNLESVNKLKEKHINVFHQNLPKLPFENKFFDIIHISHVVEHLEPQILYESLTEIVRCCKDGGAIVISAPLLWEGFYADLSHIKPYSPFVFQKYLCNGNQDNLTREMISNQFNVEKLEYRYRKKGLAYSLKVPQNLVFKVLYKIQRAFVQGFTYYEKTGYTLVLRKK